MIPEESPHCETRFSGHVTAEAGSGLKDGGSRAKQLENQTLERRLQMEHEEPSCNERKSFMRGA